MSSSPEPASAAVAETEGASTKVDFSANLYASPREKAVKYGLGACALLTVLTTLGIIGILLYESVGFFLQVSVIDFLTGTEWRFASTDPSFGVLPLVAGTLLITVIAAAVAMPIGLASAIYISEYASPRARRWLKPSLEVLAGVPTVVYGFFALTFVSGVIIQGIDSSLPPLNALSAGLVVGIMIIPMVASVSEDAIRAVPNSLAEGAYALGATKFEVVLRVIVPAALSGIIASFILALSRAIGETMIVAIAAGATANLTANPLESIQTMTGFIVQVAKGDIDQGTISYQSLFAVGLLLYLITLGMNLAANWIIRRYRENY
ncbi:MAG: phosphate ABC transporter permease subunit PstC [Longimonas sp.]|uniref:phosphate ABC transporter permease subunit PstC n=1 Tax=Longimonas sp. TaxID=2039626 RepID=UPI0033608EB5